MLTALPLAGPISGTLKGEGVEVVEYRNSPSYPRFRIGSDGTAIGPSGRTLTLMPNKDGYRFISIYLGDGRWKRMSVHALVCEAFHGARPQWADGVAHADGDPANNAASNVRWATVAENAAERKLHGRDLVGERHHQAKLTEASIHALRADRDAGFSLSALGRKYGIGVSQVSRIVRRQSWGHI